MVQCSNRFDEAFLMPTPEKTHFYNVGISSTCFYDMDMVRNGVELVQTFQKTANCWVESIPTASLWVESIPT